MGPRGLSCGTPKSFPCPDIAFPLHPKPGLAMVGSKRPARSPGPLEPAVLPLAPGPKPPRLLQARRTQSLSPGSERHGREASRLALTRVAVETFLQVPHLSVPLSWTGEGRKGAVCRRAGCYEEMGPVNSCQGPGVVLNWLRSTVSKDWATRGSWGGSHLRNGGGSPCPFHLCRSGLASAFRNECPQGRGQGHRMGAQRFRVCQVPRAHPGGALLSTVCWAVAPPHPGVSLWSLGRGGEALAPRAGRQWPGLDPSCLSPTCRLLGPSGCCPPSSPPPLTPVSPACSSASVECLFLQEAVLDPLRQGLPLQQAPRSWTSQGLSGNKDRAAKQRWGDKSPRAGSPREARLGGA